MSTPRSLSFISLCTLCLVATACGDSPSDSETSDIISTDGSSSSSGTEDGGTGDGGTGSTDTGSSGSSDSGTTGSTDSGSTGTTDSGTTDSGTTDSSTDTTDSGTDTTGTDTGGGDCVEILGDCSHDPGTLNITTILNGSDGLAGPTDVEFNPDESDELWVTNRDDYSMVVTRNTNLGNQQSYRIQENFGGGVHFLAKPAAIAFGQSGTFATAQQEDGWTQPQTPYDFMGPTLWGSSLQTFDGGHAGHLDMLHNSPNSSGIAWAGGNVYWIYDGYHGSLSRYDFVQDHGLGGTDHSDGIMHRYLDGEMGYEPGVPSHLVWDAGTETLYAADTQNGLIVALDASTGSMGGWVEPDYDGGTQRYITGSQSSVFVDGSSLSPALQKPSGMEAHDGLLFVTDYATGRINAFDMSGNLIDYLDTGFGNNSIMGITFGDDGSLYVVSHADNTVYRIAVN